MTLKEQLYQVCQDYIDKRISNYKNELSTIKESLESMEKSSDESDDSGAGKLHTDFEKYNTYLAEAIQQKEQLKQINTQIFTANVWMGSLVQTNAAQYFISISAGKIEIDGKIYYAVSPISPIGELLLSKKKGDTYEFNQNSFQIIDVL
ncbi:MAG: transcription elongation factor [Flavobacteriales bacterium CG_4_9_14_3_um_filter_40_17]|nr:MAG: transcription elongation factor [Flavobacteriales bacterium CG_4_9_14_3_um_filter_40_17]